MQLSRDEDMKSGYEGFCNTLQLPSLYGQTPLVSFILLMSIAGLPSHYFMHHNRSTIRILTFACGVARMLRVISSCLS
jgi:hypothetical protein